MKGLLSMMMEVVRIVLVLGIVYWLLGVIVFGTVYDKWSYSAALSTHFAITILLTFLWYRKRGRHTGWF